MGARRKKNRGGHFIVCPICSQSKSDLQKKVITFNLCPKSLFSSQNRSVFKKNKIKEVFTFNRVHYSYFSAKVKVHTERPPSWCYSCLGGRCHCSVCSLPKQSLTMSSNDKNAKAQKHLYFALETIMTFTKGLNLLPNRLSKMKNTPKFMRQVAG